MLYISAQPDESYFIWQLEIQLDNMNSIGIKKEDIHILVGYNPEKGLNPEFLSLMKRNNLGTFFAYPDDRILPQYLSSIRPNILKKHFLRYPELAQRILFYHDCDILFRERISEDLFNKDDIWYFSDTTSYISSKYIKKHNKRLFYDVCEHIGISSTLVENNDQNAGGAQYILKNISHTFWEDVEIDSEKIFNFFTTYNKKLKKGKTIQAWCADMWAVFWNALKANHTVRIHEELNFCWPKDHISLWNSHKIFHNSGVFLPQKDLLFCKSLYKTSSPYYVNMEHLQPNTCTQIMVDYVKRLGKFVQRLDLKDFTLIIPIHIDRLSQQRTLDTLIRFWKKSFNIHIYVVEYGDKSRLNKDKIYSDGVSFEFIESENIEDTSCINFLIDKIVTKYIVYSDANMFVEHNRLNQTFQQFIDNDEKIVFPYNVVQEVDLEIYKDLSEKLILDPSLKELEFGKKRISSVGGEIFIISSKNYKKMLKENSFRLFDPLGINLERILRANVFDVKIEKISGAAYFYNFNEFDAVTTEDYKKKLIELSSYNKYDFVCENNRLLNKTNDQKPIHISSISTYILRNENDKDLFETCLQEFSDKSEFNVKTLSSTGNYWRKIIESIKDSKKQNEDYIILCDSLHRFESSYSKDLLEHIVNSMYKYSIDLVSLGHVQGGMKNIKVLTSNLIYTSAFFDTSFTLVRKECFDNLLNFKYLNCFSVGYNLSMAVKNTGIGYPFISKKRSLNDLEDNSVKNTITEVLWTIENRGEINDEAII